MELHSQGCREDSQGNGNLGQMACTHVSPQDVRLTRLLTFDTALETQAHGCLPREGVLGVCYLVLVELGSWVYLLMASWSFHNADILMNPHWWRREATPASFL